MKPVEPPSTLNVWILTSLTSTGSIMYHAPASYSSGVHPGYYTTLEDAQQEQLLLALQGKVAHIFQLDFPRPT